MPPSCPPTDAPEAIEPESAEASKIRQGVITRSRIAHIVDLMREGQFRRGKTAKALAKDWDLSEDYLFELTAEASKRVRKQLTNADELAAEVIPGLLSTYHTAVDDNDAKAVHSLGGLLLDMAGLKAPKKLEHSSKDGLGGLLALAFPGAPPPDDE